MSSTPDRNDRGFDPDRQAPRESDDDAWDRARQRAHDDDPDGAGEGWGPCCVLGS